MSTPQKIDIAAILARRLEAFKNIQEAADHFKVSTQAVAKFQQSLNFPTVGWQTLVDELQRDNRLWLLDAPGSPPTPPKADDKPPEGAPAATLAVMAPAPHDPAELALAVIAAAPTMQRDDRIAVMSTMIATNKADVEILIPASQTRDIPPALLVSIMGNSLNLRGARVSVEQQETVEESKNLLLQRFLESPCEWALLLATNIIAPFGNPGWMKRFAGSPFAPEFSGLRTLDRLTGNPSRKIVGGLYGHGGKLAIAAEFGDETDEGKAAKALVLEKGPQNSLIEVPWLASGIMAIHRSVLEAIRKGNPDIEAKTRGIEPFPFFAPMVGQFGGDKRFGALAKRAGHKCYLDLAIMGASVMRSPVYPKA